MMHSCSVTSTVKLDILIPSYTYTPHLLRTTKVPNRNELNKVMPKRAALVQVAGGQKAEDSSDSAPDFRELPEFLLPTEDALDLLESLLSTIMGIARVGSCISLQNSL